MDFKRCFRILTGHDPYPWQCRLWADLVQGIFPPSLILPTALGKTSVITIWVLALAQWAIHPRSFIFPRRLGYIINRRQVVDQATAEAERIRQNLSKLPEIESALKSLCALPHDDVLAISTLRGQFADNREWLSDPTRPAIVVGTVDMIGSRLLFSGYRCGFMREPPLHAAYLGQDILLVHDEASLDPAFDSLLKLIQAEQQKCDLFPMHVIEMTATSRNNQKTYLSDKDINHPIAKKRIETKKWLQFHSVQSPKDIPYQIVKCALKYKDSQEAIIIFCRKIDDINVIHEKMVQEVGKDQILLLTGTIRGLERDNLLRTAIYARFQPSSERQVPPQEGTVYLICNAAGEFGSNISSEYHAICDLAAYDNMQQRLGRIGRWGDTEPHVDVVYSIASDGNSGYQQSMQKTFVLLQKLPQKKGRYCASSKNLMNLPTEESSAAFAPSPIIPRYSDIVFDMLSMTTIRKELGCPPVDKYLHGIAEGESDTYVAWRKEVEVLQDQDELSNETLSNILIKHPVKPHEMLRDATHRVTSHIADIAQKHPNAIAWLVSMEYAVETCTLKELSQKDQKELRIKIILLPPFVGGLQNGLLSGSSPYDSSILHDVADVSLGGDICRQRIWTDEKILSGMVLVNEIKLEDQTLQWYSKPKSNYYCTPSKDCSLDQHNQDVLEVLKLFITKLKLPQEVAVALLEAAPGHDLGKNREIWQSGIGNDEYPQKILAKSSKKIIPYSKYRHEFGTLIDTTLRDDISLHAMATHHGRARPCFRLEECIDLKTKDDIIREIAQEVPRRFSRLQRKYGRWGLAYIESLLRSADWEASKQESK